MAVAVFQGVLRQSGCRGCALAGAAVAVGALGLRDTVGAKARDADKAQGKAGRRAVYAQTGPGGSALKKRPLSGP